MVWNTGSTSVSKIVVQLSIHMPYVKTGTNGKLILVKDLKKPTMSNNVMVTNGDTMHGLTICTCKDSTPPTMSV